MEHDARSVANEMLRRARDANSPVTHLKVMKLVYFSHAWMLGLYHEPLQVQPVEAWRYGPVVRDVYRSLRRYGGEPINRPISIADEEYSPTQKDIMDQVWKVYGKYTARQLSAITHAPGTPWHQVWHQWGKSAVIPDPMIEAYYSDLYEQSTRES